MENIINKLFRRNKSMKDVESALRLIQGRLKEGDRIIITKDGWNIRLADKTEEVSVYPHERRPDDIDADMHKAMFGG
jgi:hypothetical protein